MTSHNKQRSQSVYSKLAMENNFPTASHDPFGDDDEAQERRREERRRRKKEKRRERSLPEEEGDPDLLIETSKKPKRKKKKKQRPELWVAEDFFEEDEFDEAFEYDDAPGGHLSDDDWYDE